MKSSYQAIHSRAPRSMTIDRFDDLDEVIVAQTTMLCCRHGCCRPSLNWVLQDANNYQPGSSPFALPKTGGWMHEESTYFQRCCCAPFRETTFVQHAGDPPASLSGEDFHCCLIQCEKTSPLLSDKDLRQEVVATHEKEMTCSVGSCCCPPYLLTRDATGRILGKTEYVCCYDLCCIPTFNVRTADGSVKYLLRPNTCCCGVCIEPRCGGKGGKCCRVPFYLRDPHTEQTLYANVQEGQAQITNLWSGLINEAFYDRHAYHVAFPADASPEDRIVLLGSTILVHVSLYEHEKDSNDSGNTTI